MAGCKRLIQLAATKSSSFSNIPRGFLATPSPSSTTSLLFDRFDTRQISQLVKSNGNRVFLDGNLKLLRDLEAQGVPSKQAEAIISAITDVLNDSLENIAHYMVSKSEMQKELHLSMLLLEIEKFRVDIEKMRREQRSELLKVTVDQRLDLSLAKWRIRNEIDQTTDLTNKLNWEIHSLRARINAVKSDVLIGILVSIAAVGLATLCIVL